jgi:molecular chaperone GrpE
MTHRMHRRGDRRQISPTRGVGSRPVSDPQDLRGPANDESSDGSVAEAAEEPLVDSLLETAQAERDRYLDQLQRTTAEYANYRRRTEQDRAQQRLAANEQLLREFVPVLDDLQRGLNALSPADHHSKLAEGMRLVEQKFLAALARHGVTPIEALGQKFDPMVHEAVEMEPTGGDTVVAVYAPGYRLGNNVLKPAMVKVGTGEGRQSPTSQPSQ